MSRHHDAAKWANETKGHRARIAAARVVFCIHCGGAIDTVVDAWDVGHVVDLADGGGTGQVGPAHRRCNRSSGGKRGATTRHAAARDTQRMRAW